MNRTKLCIGLVAAVLIIVLIFVFFPREEDDSPKFSLTPVNSTECPEGFPVEAYTLLRRGSRYRLCSKKGSEEIFRKTARKCQTTPCLVNISSDPCGFLADKYFISDNLIVKNESLRDSCIHATEGEGIAAICCVPDSISNLLISGYGAELNEFPHQARVMPVMCGGTVYNKDTVITAAHCLIEDGILNPNSSKEVVLGTNFGSLQTKENRFEVKEIIVHQNYSGWENSSAFGEGIYFNDIAILKLGREIDFGNKNIKALPIAPEGFNAMDYAKQAVIVGWGTSEDLTLTEHLQKANFILRSDQRCFKEHEFHKDVGEYAEQILCVGGVLDGTYSYTAGGGDSGGPAVCRDKDGWAVLCGVTSYGGDDELCREHYDEESCPPSGYAEVSYFRRWIEENGGVQEEEGMLKRQLYGEKVDGREYKNQVRIFSKEGPSCGGTLVGKDVVVSAGHCLLNDEGVEREGIRIEALGKDYSVKEVVKMDGFKRYWKIEQFNRGEGNQFRDPPYQNNIAWVKLNEKVEIKERHLARLPKEGDPEILGGGSGVEISYYDEWQQMGKREFDILGVEECRRRIARFKIFKLDVSFDERKVFCAVEKYSGGSICDRELGGGLFCDGNVLCGVQQFRLCQYSLPNVFMNVRFYAGKIRETIRK